MESEHSIESNSESPRRMEERSSPKRIPLIDSLDEMELVLPERPLVVLGIDLSHLSPISKYFSLSVVMMASMCLHGFLQEYITYGWFARKYSIFVTLLHFVSFATLTLIQRGLRFHVTTERIHRRLPWSSHFLICVIKTMTVYLNNLSTSEINYPAKVLFKSAGPVVTMLIGVFWFRKVYLAFEYISVFLLVLGLYIFLMGGYNNDSINGPQWSPYGVVLVCSSLVLSSIIPILQEYWICKYNVCHDEILYYSFFGSMLLSLALTIFYGELFSGLQFVSETGTPTMWNYYIMFQLFGFIGAHCAAALTTCCGALVSGITFTTRKAITIVLSFAIFPSRNVLTAQHIVGGAVFVSGLLLRIIGKDSWIETATPSRKYSVNSFSEFSIR